MKTVTTIILFLFLSTLLSAQNRTTVILVDNSASLSQDSSLLRQKARNIMEVAGKAIRSKGDRVILAYIYENSSSVSNGTEFVFDPPILNTVGMGVQQTRLAEINFKKKYKKARKRFLVTVVKQAIAYEPDRPGTHILSTLSLLQRWNRQYGSLDVAFFSDMIENSSEFRHLNNTKFKDIQQATITGQNDAQKVAHTYGLSEKFLNDVSVTVWLPVKDMDNREVFRWIKPYWLGVFSSFGLSSSRLKFQ